MPCVTDDVTQFSKQPYIIGPIIVPLYRWGNSFREGVHIFWGRKKSHVMLVCREGDRHIEMVKWGPMLPISWKTLEKCHWHCFHVSKSMITTEFIMPLYLSTIPLTDGNYIYKILSNDLKLDLNDKSRVCGLVTHSHRVIFFHHFGQ